MAEGPPRRDSKKGIAALVAGGVALGAAGVWLANEAHQEVAQPSRQVAPRQPRERRAPAPAATPSPDLSILPPGERAVRRGSEDDPDASDRPLTEAEVLAVLAEGDTAEQADKIFEYLKPPRIHNLEKIQYSEEGHVFEVYSNTQPSGPPIAQFKIHEASGGSLSFLYRPIVSVAEVTPEEKECHNLGELESALVSTIVGR